MWTPCIYNIAIFYLYIIIYLFYYDNVELFIKGGDLCLWKHPKNTDRRRDVDLTTFVDFRNSLEFDCGSSKSYCTFNFPNYLYQAAIHLYWISIFLYQNHMYWPLINFEAMLILLSLLRYLSSHLQHKQLVKQITYNFFFPKTNH